MSESYYDLKAPIRSLVLKENYNFALIFPIDVRREMCFEIYAFRVARTYPIQRVYVLPEMNPGGEIGFKYLGEGGVGVGDDIFTMSEEKPYRILHFGFGVHPENVRVWVQQPSEYTLTGWSRRTITNLGDPVDYIDGFISPFNEPTRASEMVMWFKGSIYFGVKNYESIAVKPKIRFLGAGYDTWMITDKTIVDKMVKGIIPCRFISVGGLSEIKYTVPKEWEGKGFKYDLATVQNLMRGGV